MEVPPKKLEVELPHDPEIPLLSMYLRKAKTLIQKNTCTLMFIAAIFAIANLWKQFKYPSTDECIIHIIHEKHFMRNTGLDEHKLESRLLGEIPKNSDMQMTPPLRQKVKKK